MPDKTDTLLVVEDNELNRDLLCRRLKLKGYGICEAADGVEAINVMQRQPVSLVLMDMQLPIQDGWTSCQIIREQPEWADIPIIALTAHAMTIDRQRAKVVGCNEYETKPIDFDGLVAKIDRLLALRGAEETHSA